MSPLATDTTDTYLDVLRTLGVSDAELRRRHDVGADEPLRAAIAASLDSPTDDLLATLAATGRVLAPDGDPSSAGESGSPAEADGSSTGADAASVGETDSSRRTDAASAAPRVPVDGERLAAALGQFGYVLEVSSAGDELELDVYDAVRDEGTALRPDPTWAAIRDSLAEELLGPAGIVLVPLLDGRTLVTDARRLERLRVAYGPRIEPFGTPLLSPETDLDEPSGSEGADVVAGDWAGGAAAAERAGPQDERAAVHAARQSIDDPAGIDADVVEPAGAADDALDDAAASLAIDAADLGGGPRKTVSTSGIDDVFDELEADAADASERGSPGPATTTSSAEDPLADWGEPTTTAEGAEDGGLAGGGPDRTVSETSADDILDRASGGADFETVAAEQSAPDAVRDDAAEVSELAAAVSDVQSDPGADEPSVEELVSAAEESTEDSAGVRDDGGDGADAERDEDLLDRLGSTLGQ